MVVTTDGLLLSLTYLIKNVFGHPVVALLVAPFHAVARLYSSFYGFLRLYDLDLHFTLLFNGIIWLVGNFVI